MICSRQWLVEHGELQGAVELERVELLADVRAGYQASVAGLGM